MSVNQGPLQLAAAASAFSVIVEKAVSVAVSTVPPAGSEFTITVPAGQRWRVIVATVQLVTSAAVGNRTIRPLITDGVNILARISDSAQGPSTTERHSWFVASAFQASDVTKNAPLPFPLVMEAGWVFSSSTNNLDVADAFTAGRLLYQRLDT